MTAMPTDETIDDGERVNTDPERFNPGYGVRSQFPILCQASHLAYLDTAASAQKPAVVIDRLTRYLQSEHANIHRGAYRLSAEATERYDEARAKIAHYINAPSANGVVFVRGTTEAINLVANSYGMSLAPGDVVMLSFLEHHSNIVPWQLLEKRRGIKIVWSEVTDHGDFDLEGFRRDVTRYSPKLIAITALSNALGTVVPIAEVVQIAHGAGALVLVDGAQSLPHERIDVQGLDIDFLAASGHKMYGPTGIGFLYGKESLLEKMDPFMGGGDMISMVTIEGSSWAEIPRKFEAGTPAIGEAIAFGTAIDFLSEMDPAALRSHEELMFRYGFELLSNEPGVTVHGPATVGGAQHSILPFTVEGVHPHDISTIADSHNVQIRAGHHCAMPLLKRLKLQATARASIGCYTVEEDFDRLVVAIREARRLFGS